VKNVAGCSPRWASVREKEATQISGGIWGWISFVVCVVQVVWGWWRREEVQCTLIERKF